MFTKALLPLTALIITMTLSGCQGNAPHTSQKNAPDANNNAANTPKSPETPIQGPGEYEQTGQAIGKKIDEAIQNMQQQFENITAPGGAIDTFKQESTKAVTDTIMKMQNGLEPSDKSEQNTTKTPDKPQNSDQSSP